MVHEPGQVGDAGPTARPDGVLEGVEHEFGGHAAGRSPADNTAGEGVEYERDVDRPRPGGDVPEVRHPEPVRAGRGEVAVDEIGRPDGRGVGERGPHSFAPQRPVPAVSCHQPLYRAAGHVVAVAAQMQPHLPGSVAGDEALLPGGGDQLNDLRIPQRSLRAGATARRRGDRGAVLAQHAADRLDPEHIAVLIDERGQNFGGRSSSAAKKAEAALRSSFARRSSAFSFFSSRISASSWVVYPVRAAPSTSACRTHLRSVSGEPMPILAAIVRIASNSLGYLPSAIDSATARTARSRSSRGYLLGRAMTSSSN